MRMLIKELCTFPNQRGCYLMTNDNLHISNSIALCKIYPDVGWSDCRAKLKDLLFLKTLNQQFISFQTELFLPNQSRKRISAYPLNRPAHWNILWTGSYIKDLSGILSGWKSKSVHPSSLTRSFAFELIKRELWLEFQSNTAVLHKNKSPSAVLGASVEKPIWWW